MKHFSPSRVLFVVQADDLWQYRSIHRQGKRKRARHARTLFDDGRKSGLLCIALCKAQSEKFLPCWFSHESEIETSRGAMAPDRRRAWHGIGVRPANRKYPGLPANQGGQGVYGTHSHLATDTHGSRSSQGTFIHSFSLSSSSLLISQVIILGDSGSVSLPSFALVLPLYYSHLTLP